MKIPTQGEISSPKPPEGLHFECAYLWYNLLDPEVQACNRYTAKRAKDKEMHPRSIFLW